MTPSIDRDVKGHKKFISDFNGMHKKINIKKLFFNSHMFNNNNVINLMFMIKKNLSEYVSHYNIL